MDEKKGFFDFFKGITRAGFKEEEENQRNYARAKAKEERKQENTDTAEKTAAGKDVEQEVSFNDESGENDEEILFCKGKLEEMLNLAGFKGDIKVIKKDKRGIYLEIINSDDAGRIIGKEGSTLYSFQVLLRTFAYKHFGKNVSVIIDAGDYRKKKNESIKEYALKASKEVLKNRGRVELKAMNAADRRLVHMLFEKDSRINTYSVGDGEYRRVVLEKGSKAIAL
ncbi:MAG: KH domain-containing protein [bacterium]|nr:KH domain-containing protein [bacterium]